MLPRIFFPFLILLLITNGCHSGVTVTKRDEDIDLKLREEIKNLNAKLITSFKANDYQGFKALSSFKLQELGEATLKNFIEQIYNGNLPNNHNIVTEIHVSSASTDEDYEQTLKINENTLNEAKLVYKQINQQTYISLLSFDATERQLLITCLYGKYGDEWKVNNIQVGLHTILLKTAPELYVQSLELHKKNYLLDALNNLVLADFCKRPAADLWTYNKENEMTTYRAKLEQEFRNKYNFPYQLENIKTKPEIFSTAVETNGKSFYPLVEYYSNIKLTDTLQLNAENLQLHKIIGNIFSGIDKGKELIFYKAYDINTKDETLYHRFERKVNSLE